MIYASEQNSAVVGDDIVLRKDISGHDQGLAAERSEYHPPA
jgi:hypothetical protein